MESHNILDEMVAEDQVEVLKAAMPYLPPSGQRFVSVYAKFLELSNTIRLFSKPEPTGQMQTQEYIEPDPLEMLSACSKVCHGPVRERIDSLINTLAMVQLLELSKDSPQP